MPTYKVRGANKETAKPIEFKVDADTPKMAFGTTNSARAVRAGPLFAPPIEPKREATPASPMNVLWAILLLIGLTLIVGPIIAIIILVIYLVVRSIACRLLLD